MAGDLRNNYKAILTRFGPYLTEHVDTEAGLYNELLAASVINETNKQNFKENGAGLYKQIERLIDHMKRRPFEDFVKFCDVLVKTNQTHIVKDITGIDWKTDKPPIPIHGNVPTDGQQTCDAEMKECNIEGHGKKESKQLSKGDLRLLVIGKTGTGKSSTGNFLLGKHEFNAGTSAGSVTKVAQSGSRHLGGREVKVVDTPGFMDNEMTSDEIAVQVTTSLGMATPGFHAILLVLSISECFTRSDVDTVTFFHKMFGDRMFDYTLVVFTHFEQLEREGKTILDYVGDVKELTDLLTKCRNRNFTIGRFVNRDVEEQHANKMLEAVDDIVRNNGDEPFYTGSLFKEVQGAIKREVEVEKQRLLEEKERQIAIIREDEKKKYNAEIEAERRSNKKIQDEMKVELETLTQQFHRVSSADVREEPAVAIIPSDQDIDEESRKHTGDNGMITKWGRNIHYHKNFGWYRWKERWECRTTDSESEISAKVNREYKEGTQALAAALKKLFFELHKKYNQ